VKSVFSSPSHCKALRNNTNLWHSRCAAIITCRTPAGGSSDTCDGFGVHRQRGFELAQDNGWQPQQLTHAQPSVCRSSRDCAACPATPPRRLRRGSCSSSHAWAETPAPKTHICRERAGRSYCWDRLRRTAIPARPGVADFSLETDFLVQTHR